MQTYSYKDSIKSDSSDELINTYLLRPIAGLFVWTIYRTPITPNQITIAATIVGLLAARFYLVATPQAIAFAGLLVTLKDILDSADGQLARAKKQYSRIGRFLDSIGDVIVNAAVFGSIGWILWEKTGSTIEPLLAFTGFIGITLRVSYHVFYHSSYLHLQHQYGLNRVTEEIREEDERNGGMELPLQRIFQIIYGWQDRLMASIDGWCKGSRGEKEFLQRWYLDRKGLLLSGFLGMGTELFLLMLCSVTNDLVLYLKLNLLLMNSIWVVTIVYRFALARTIKDS